MSFVEPIKDEKKIDPMRLVLKDGNIRGQGLRKEKKTGKTRQIPLNDSALEALRGYLKSGMVSDSFLFTSYRTKGRLTRIQAYRILNTAAERVGLGKIGTHTLRKTFGYHVYMRSGGNLGLVQKLLNHSSSSETLRYIGITQEDMDDAVLKLNLGLGPTGKGK